MTIEVGARFDAAFGNYRVKRIDGDVVYMVDINRPTSMVMPTRDKIGPGLNFWPVVDEPRSSEDRTAAPVVDEPRSSEDRAAKPARAKPPPPPRMTSIVGVPFRPRITDAEACPWLAKLGRYSCGFATCPPACPRSGVDAGPAPGPIRNPDPPPLTELEVAAIWARVGLARAGAGGTDPAPVFQASPPAAPPPSTTPAPEGGTDPAPAPGSSPAAARRPFPPCFVCGQIRPVMVTLVPGPGPRGKEHATMCSRCYLA